jgi:hypothetical protein
VTPNPLKLSVAADGRQQLDGKALDGQEMRAGGRILGAILALGVIAGAGTAEARRLPPKDVAPVVVDGIRYKVVHFGALHEKSQNGGYVQAWDVKTRKLLWDRMVYRVSYDENLEKDVQDDFIAAIRVKGGHLFVKTERSEEFDMDLGAGQVRALTALSPHIEVASATKASDAVPQGVAADGAVRLRNQPGCAVLLQLWRI